MFVRCALILGLLGSLVATSRGATIDALSRRTCEPGTTTRLALSGKELVSPLRVWGTLASAKIAVMEMTSTSATLEIQLPADAPLGTWGIWIASGDDCSGPWTMLNDDLPFVPEDETHDSRQAAQEVPTFCCVDGICNGGVSDFYRIHLSPDQIVSIEVLAQQLDSAMDPTLRIWNADGNQIALVDDDSVGPDCRTTLRSELGEDIVIEVHDSRFGGPFPYHLRIGDFPLVSHSFPLALPKGPGKETELRDIRLVGDEEEFPVTTLPKSFTETESSFVVAARRLGGKSSAWRSVRWSDLPNHLESIDASKELSWPVAIQGRLREPGERDSYWISGMAGEKIHVSTRTRSMGCSTVLQLELSDANGKKLAETAVTEEDEWAFDFTFPATGKYRLDAQDILHRGGPQFDYEIDVVRLPPFRVHLADGAMPRGHLLMTSDQGAAVIDLKVERLGWDGEIEFDLQHAPPGVILVNGRILSGATSARLVLAVDGAWDVNSLAGLRITARPVTSDAGSGSIHTTTWERKRWPQVMFTPEWREGLFVLSAGAPVASRFEIDSSEKISLARNLEKQTRSVTVKRREGFQGTLEMVRPPEGLPVGWTAEAKSEGDQLQLVLTRSSSGKPNVSSTSASTSESIEAGRLSCMIYAEQEGRGRWERVDIPVEWFDSLRLTVDPWEPALPGEPQVVHIRLQRAGTDMQPVRLELKGTLENFSFPSIMEVPANQNEVSVTLSPIRPSENGSQSGELWVEGSSTYEGATFSVRSNSVPFRVLGMPDRFEVYPTEIRLGRKYDRSRLIVTGWHSNADDVRVETPRDWSSDVRMESSRPDIAEVRDGVVYPKSDGVAEILLTINDWEERIPVRVMGLKDPHSIQFENEVLASLSKQGCNAGACHGSPSGKGGFRLSLRAFDRGVDEITLIREDFGRRVNPWEPQRSLLLQKPLMGVAHGGGKQLHETDATYEILREWISQGASKDPPETARVTRLELYPGQRRVMDRRRGGQQIGAIAHFSDGSKRDVTHLAVYESSDTTVAVVNSQGRVSARGKGEAAILVRYLDQVESLPLMFIESSRDYRWDPPAPQNYIDSLVDAKLRLLEYSPAPLADDSEFLRRVYLDVVGILPSVEETRAFLTSEDPQKRSDLIDSLLDRPEHAKFWALKWGDLLKLTRKGIGDEGVFKYHRWVENAIRQNMPYDEFARQLLTSSGSTLANPPANFFRTAADMNESVENVSQLFLGARLQCAKCHNHPFERWTQNNYYGLGAFFERVKRRKTNRSGELFIWTSKDGEVTQPRTGETMKPWLPLVGNIEADEAEDRRKVFAKWLVRQDNPYFARIEVNRIWSQLFVRGIVDPIDDFRDSNPPSHGPLLDALADDFVKHGFDRRHLLRSVLNSRTYQATFRPNESNRDDRRYFSHQIPRMLTAEQILDAVNQVLGLQQPLGNLPAGTRVTQLPAPDLTKIDFLRTFGQPERSTVCACEREHDSNLGMAIELLNGTLLHEKLRDANNRFRLALAQGATTETIVRDLYLGAFCRPPKEEEMQEAMSHIAKRSEPAAAIEDICWALINTDEFLFQH